MRFESFIAKRLKGDGGVKYSKPIINIAVWGIALGVVVMILTLNIVKGFQSAVSEKVLAFNAPIELTKISQSDSYETKPFFEIDFEDLPQSGIIKNIQSFATKAGVIRVDQDIHGVILKGIGENYDQSSIEKHLTRGSIIDMDSVNRKVLISEKLAAITKTNIGDKLKVFFITKNKSRQGFQQRMYPFEIQGIYNSGMGNDIDERLIICPIKYIQKLNYWEENEVGGYEILLNESNPDLKGVLNEKLSGIQKIKNDFEDVNFEKIQSLKITTIQERIPQVFDWLSLFDTHIIIVLVIIILISVINMTAVLFIQIIEKWAFIGNLKSMGARTSQIQRIFLFQALYLILKGVVLGNLLGFTLSVSQYLFQWMPLNAEVYYISYVPISFDWKMLLLVNLLTIISSILVLILPSRYIAKISPSKSIRFN